MTKFTKHKMKFIFEEDFVYFSTRDSQMDFEISMDQKSNDLTVWGRKILGGHLGEGVV